MRVKSTLNINVKVFEATDKLAANELHLRSEGFRTRPLVADD